MFQNQKGKKKEHQKENHEEHPKDAKKPKRRQKHPKDAKKKNKCQKKTTKNLTLMGWPTVHYLCGCATL
jgi:hypothetical protein